MPNQERITPKLLSEADAARYLSVSRPFLAKARMTGPMENRTPGPEYVRLGRMIRYSVAALDEWVDQFAAKMRGRKSVA